MKRLVIFIYDDCSEFDESGHEIIKQLVNISDRQIVIINGDLTAKSRINIEKYTTEIIVEDYSSIYDAWKIVLIDYLGGLNENSYDQILFMTNEYFIRKNFLERVFKKEFMPITDIWGLKKEGGSIEHSFIVFNRKVINDYSFWKIWVQYEEFEKNDFIIENYLEKAGFTWSIFFDEEENEAEDLYMVCKEHLRMGDMYHWDEEKENKIKILINYKDDICNLFSNDMLSYIVRKNNLETVKRLFNGIYVYTNKNDLVDLEARKEKIVICIWYETENNFRDSINIIEKIAVYYEIRVWINEELYKRYKDKINSSIQVNLYSDKSNFNEILNNIVYENKYENIGVLVEKQVNYVCEKDNIFLYYLKMYICNLSAINRVLDIFHDNNIVKIILPFKKITSKNYVKYYDEFMGLEQKNEQCFNINFIDAAFFCSLDSLKYFLKCNPGKTHKTMTYFFKQNGYITANLIEQDNLSEYLNHLNLIYSFICSLKEYNQFMGIKDFTEFLREIEENSKGYKILKTKNEILQTKIKKLENKLLLQKSTLEPSIKEVPIVIDIGVKGAVKNWIAKKLLRKKK